MASVCSCGKSHIHYAYGEIRDVGTVVHVYVWSTVILVVYREVVRISPRNMWLGEVRELRCFFGATCFTETDHPTVYSAGLL